MMLAESVRPEAFAGDVGLLNRLREGDEAAFATLIDLYGASLSRVANLYVSDRSLAQEVVQDTWLGFLESLDRFEGRCSLKTWLFRILVNCSRKRRVREGRDIPFSALGVSDGRESEAAVTPERFLDSSARYPGHWASPPSSWQDLPEEWLLSAESQARIRGAIESLHPRQREVITLRDVEGWTAREVCDALGLSEANQRVLLHRARSKVRGELERFIEELL